MARIKIRLWGSREDLERIAADFAAEPATVSISRLYPNRPPSKEYRMYVEIDY